MAVSSRRTPWPMTTFMPAAIRLPWLRTTPFGLPVVPDVYMRRPGVSASVTAFGMGAGALPCGQSGP